MQQSGAVEATTPVGIGLAVIRPGGEILPLGQDGRTVEFKSLAIGEVSLGIEMLVDVGMD